MPIAVRKVPDFFESPEWSPDGQTISAFYFSAKEKSSSLIEVPAQGGQENQLTQHRWPVPATGSSWISDGSGLIINVQETATGPRQLQYVSFVNGNIRRITNDLNYY